MSCIIKFVFYFFKCKIEVPSFNFFFIETTRWIHIYIANSIFSRNTKTFYWYHSNSMTNIFIVV